jgi:hypothetical protein
MSRRPDVSKAIDRLITYGRREPWGTLRAAFADEFFQAIADAFETDPETILTELELIGFADTFTQALLELGFAAELGADRRNLIEEYLKRRGWQETPRARHYLAALRGSQLSLYEVTTVEPGEWVEVRDVIRGGAPQRVGERIGSRSLVQWDRLAARLIDVDGELMFTGGILPYPAEAVTRLEGVLKRTGRKVSRELRKAAAERGVDARGRRKLKVRQDEILPQAGKAFLHIWLVHMLKKLHAPLPEFRNTEGEVITFACARLPLARRDASAVSERLDALPGWQRAAEAGELVWHWRTAPRTAKVTPSAGSAGERLGQEGARTILATAELTKRALTVEANSRERMERALALLGSTLEGLVGEPEVTFEDPAAALSESEDIAESQDSERQTTAEAMQAILQFKDDHYRRTLDEPIPMLGDRSPRDCVRTAAGRRAVVRWLKNLENLEQRQAQRDQVEPYDSSWIWRELGLDPSR